MHLSMKYSALIMDHFQNPRNTGPLPEASTVGESSNPVCLDNLRLYLQVDTSSGKICAASFQAEGCVPSVAAGSYLTEEVLGKTPQEASVLTASTLEAALGGLPATKRHAAHLAIEALHDALARLPAR